MIHVCPYEVAALYLLLEAGRQFLRAWRLR